MPNHVTNLLSFTGPAERIVELKNKIRGEEQGQAIDFNNIIPMPTSLQITSGSQVDYGVAILLSQEREDDSKLLPILNYPWVKAENIKTPKKLIDHLIKQGMVNLDEARMALDNLDKYGHKDWYSWSIANWGTKWNAYAISEDDHKIRFDTAWSTPLPIIEKLSELFFDVTIKLQYADEDFGFNCGEIILEGGNIIAENIPEGGSGEAYILASKIKDISLEELICQIGDSEDENFVYGLLSAMFEQFSPQEVVEELYILNDEGYFSYTFLSTLKRILIDNEYYELIGRVDDKINQKAGEK